MFVIGFVLGIFVNVSIRQQKELNHIQDHLSATSDAVLEHLDMHFQDSVDTMFTFLTEDLDPED